MKINIFGSTGVIGIKSLDILKYNFPEIKINLLCAKNNLNILLKQIEYYKPNYVFLDNNSKYHILKKKIKSNIKILNYDELLSYLKTFCCGLLVGYIEEYPHQD